MRIDDLARKAAGLVAGDRQQDYGDPRANFERVAILWNAHLSIRSDPAAPLDALDVAQMLSDLKRARIQSGPFKEDSYLDKVAYGLIEAALAFEDNLPAVHGQGTD